MISEMSDAKRLFDNFSVVRCFKSPKSLTSDGSISGFSNRIDWLTLDTSALCPPWRMVSQHTASLPLSKVPTSQAHPADNRRRIHTASCCALSSSLLLCFLHQSAASKQYNIPLILIACLTAPHRSPHHHGRYRGATLIRQRFNLHLFAEARRQQGRQTSPARKRAARYNANGSACSIACCYW
jgi:hypothetical protein